MINFFVELFIIFSSSFTWEAFAEFQDPTTELKGTAAVFLLPLIENDECNNQSESPKLEVRSHQEQINLKEKKKYFSPIRNMCTATFTKIYTLQ